MKRTAIAAFALCLLGGTSVLAEPGEHGDRGQRDGGHDGGHNDGGHNDSGHNDSGHNNGGQSHATPQVHNFQGAQSVQHSFQNNGAPQGVVQGPPREFDRHVQHNGGPAQVFVQHAPNNNGMVVPRDFRDDHRRDVGDDRGRDVRDNGGRDIRDNGERDVRDNGRRDFDDRGQRDVREDRGRERFDPDRFPRIFRPEHRFEWRDRDDWAPHGWFYRTWFYGQILPWGWFGPDLWISDYWYYDLPTPPYGYEWIRNGPDALLVDTRSGVVVEVVPGIFY
jgi:Ni/Co efflux regulator RcnB